MSPAPPARVVISHAPSDHSVAQELVSRVEAHGIGCWIAERDVPFGADRAEEIVKAIATAPVMVLVFSASANTSADVHREVERAYDRGIRVLPVRIEDAMPSAGLEYFLSTQHWLDIFPAPMEPHYARLCASLDAMLARPDSARQQTQVPPSPAPPPREVRPQVKVDATSLRRLESELAVHIGPYAKYAVGVAAAHAADLEALLQELAQRIESDAQRRQFARGCQQWLHASSGAAAAASETSTETAVQPPHFSPPSVDESMRSHATHEASPAGAQSGVVDENVQFTVFRPRQLAPDEWQPLLAFAHLASERSDAEVRKQAHAVLKGSIGEYQQVMQDAEDAVARNGVVTFVPNLPGIEFEPAERELSWRGGVHLEVFLARPLAQMLGHTARGRLSVHLGARAIAELPLTLVVAAAPDSTHGHDSRP